MQNKDIRTNAYVLRRTNYGEADRILNLITPLGKISAIAKSVRKEKSKLAGSVEMFSLIDVNIHQGKSEFGVITSAKMIRFYDKIICDLSKMELAAFVLKKISVAAEHSDNPEFFKITDQVLSAINDGVSLELVEAWFLLNYLRASGEQVNLYRDTDGDLLTPDGEYEWDFGDDALMKRVGGRISSNEIKMMRLMISTKLLTSTKVKGSEKMIPLILHIARGLNKL